MNDLDVMATYSNAHGHKLLQISLTQRGMQACGFMYDIQDARMLLINLGAAIKQWEDDNYKTDNDGTPIE